MAAPHAPRKSQGTQGGTPQPWRAQPRAKCPQSAAHSLPQCPLPTGSSAPALKGAPWAAAAQRHLGMRHRRGRSDPPFCPPRVGGGTDRGKETSPPPTPQAPRASPWGYGALAAPPPQADPPTADQAAPGTELPGNPG